MTEDDFRHFDSVIRRAGFAVEASRYDESYFGSWVIHVRREDLPPQRIAWDGRDGTLVVETAASAGGWLPRWWGLKEGEQTAEAALAQLEMPVTPDWQRDVEQERTEGWAKFYLEQALTSALKSWDEGRFADYVQALSPYKDRLSPAQLKRLEAAERLAAGKNPAERPPWVR